MMENLEAMISHTAAYPSWKQIGIQHHHGIDLMLSSLHSKQSLGCGEFLDLIPLIDWCKAVGFNVIQLLPLYDTAFDPSPYNGISSCALNPIFISLRSLPLLIEDSALYQSLELLKKFNESPSVEYQKVLIAKLNWLKEYYKRFGKQLIALDGFHHFRNHHKWVVIYSVFKVLKDQHSQAPWNVWPHELQNPSPKLIEEIASSKEDEVNFYILLQWLSYLQLMQVKSHASSQNVLLKGDIPILISPDSADVWYERSLFNMEYTAGAGPDYYNKEGQHWGFPLFAWENLEKDNYHFWKQRLMYACNFFHLYRIDHAVGFFRIWAIPKDKKPKDGFFVPSDLQFALLQGEKIFRHLLSFSSMLPIAEDLGNVPIEVKKIIQGLGIPGTFVIRWEKDLNNAFRDPKTFHPLGMTTLSTHDSATLEQWWKQELTQSHAYAAQKHWQYEQVLTKERRLAILQEVHQSSTLFHINLFQEYLALFPELIHSDPNIERINYPGKILSTNWTYKFRHPIEKICEHKELIECIRKILSP